VSSVQFQVAGAEQLECSMVMVLDDWFSIVHRFTQFSSS
jgi:hypothetical protein